MNHAVKILSGESNNVLHKGPQSYIIENVMGILMMQMVIWQLMRKRRKCRVIFNLYLQGKSVLGIVKELERLGIKSPTGKATWPKRTIDVMLSNESIWTHY